MLSNNKWRDRRVWRRNKIYKSKATITIFFIIILSICSLLGEKNTLYCRHHYNQVAIIISLHVKIEGKRCTCCLLKGKWSLQKWIFFDNEKLPIACKISLFSWKLLKAHWWWMDLIISGCTWNYVILWISKLDLLLAVIYGFYYISCCLSSITHE